MSSAGRSRIRLAPPDRVDAADEAARSIPACRGRRARARGRRGARRRRSESRRTHAACGRRTHRARHRRNLALGQLGDERVFFEDRRVAPARGPVELGDDRRPVFDADLVDAVFVAVERQQAAVAAHADRDEDAVERIEHAIRRESRAKGGAGCASLDDGVPGASEWSEFIPALIRASAFDRRRPNPRSVNDGIDGRTTSPVSMRSSRKNGSVLAVATHRARPRTTRPCHVAKNAHHDAARPLRHGDMHGADDRADLHVNPRQSAGCTGQLW